MGNIGDAQKLGSELARKSSVSSNPPQANGYVGGYLRVAADDPKYREENELTPHIIIEG